MQNERNSKPNINGTSRDAISPDVGKSMTTAFHVKHSTEQALTGERQRAYRGKYPDNIKALACGARQDGDRFGPILIETNNGARFVYRLLHRAAPMPVIGQDIEGWLLHIDATNAQGRDTFQHFGISLSIDS